LIVSIKRVLSSSLINGEVIIFAQLKMIKTLRQKIRSFQ